MINIMLDNSHLDNRQKKQTGSFYTPNCVVDYMVKEILTSFVENKTIEDILKLKIFDPAMGSGYFLLGVVDFLSKKIKELDNSLHEIIIQNQIITNCIYGMDIDPQAVVNAKINLSTESNNLRCNNSLIVDMNKEFPNVFSQGGFDVIIGNPPYIGEKGHKEFFKPIKNTLLGKNFYLSKMDYYYFFFHLGINSLKQNGKLGFITTNYYPTADGALNLRNDLYERTSLITLLNLKEVKVFGDATGQHNLITILQKGKSQNQCSVINATESGKISEAMIKEILNGQKGIITTKTQEAIYDGEKKYIRIELPNNYYLSNNEENTHESIFKKIKENSVRLDSICTVNQGIVTGADKVSNRHLEKFNIRANKGDGIFVLSNEELKGLELSRDEKKQLIRQWFKNSDIEQFSTAKDSDEYVLYLSRKKFQFEKLSKNIRNHIGKYIKIIENSVDDPPYLHRARNEAIFMGEKIVVPQRNRINKFGYNLIPYYTSADVYFITQKNNFISLISILGILNSKVMFYWLYFKGKRKGTMLELYQKPLCEIPIKKFENNNDMLRNITDVTNLLIKQQDIETNFEKLNNLIYEHYNLSTDEIKLINDLYKKQTTNVK